MITINTNMNSVCLNCQKTSDENVVLICDHELCYRCANEIKSVEGAHPMVKYRIVCPQCHKNTVTLNIKNLMGQEQENLVFVNMESSQLSENELQKNNYYPSNEGLRLSKLRQMSYSERIANLFADRKTPDITERASKASMDSKRQTNSKSRSGYQYAQIKCHTHNQPIYFYCQQEKTLLCVQCIPKHTHTKQNHRVCSVKDGLFMIQAQNKKLKFQAKNMIQGMGKCINVCKSNKSKLDQAFSVHLQLIEKQFKQLQNLLKKKLQEVKGELQKIFHKRQQQLAVKFEELNSWKDHLEDYSKYQLDSSFSNIYFYNSFTDLKSSLNVDQLDLKEFRVEDLFCFNRNASINQVEAVLSKLFVSKPEGRQSSTRPRAPSRSGNNDSKMDKAKPILYQEYKLAKKRLQKIQKLESQHKDKHSKPKDKKEDYLNNCAIQQIMKKQIEAKIIMQKNSSHLQTHRKSSASEYEKRGQKTLTPTTNRFVSNKKTKK